MLGKLEDTVLEVGEAVAHELEIDYDDENQDYTTNYWSPIFTPAHLATANSTENYHALEQTLTGQLGFLTAEVASQIINETAPAKTPGNMRLNGTLPECPDDLLSGSSPEQSPGVDDACQTTDSLFEERETEIVKNGGGQGAEEQRLGGQSNSAAASCPLSSSHSNNTKARKTPKDKRLSVVLKRLQVKFSKYGPLYSEAFMMWSSLSNATLPWKLKIYEHLSGTRQIVLLNRVVTKPVYMAIVMLAEQRKLPSKGIKYFALPRTSLIKKPQKSQFDTSNPAAFYVSKEEYETSNPGHPSVWSYKPWDEDEVPDVRLMNTDLFKEDNYSYLSKSVNKTCDASTPYFKLLLKLAQGPPS